MNVKEYYNIAIRVADEVLKNPMNSVGGILEGKLGYEKGAKGFFTDPWTLLLLPHPIGIAGRVLYKYMKNKKRQREEMEMMKRTIIAKQQAIIRKMEEEHLQNEEQKRNLQETIDFLKETQERIEQAQKAKKK